MTPAGPTRRGREPATAAAALKQLAAGEGAAAAAAAELLDVRTIDVEGTLRGIEAIRAGTLRPI